MVETASSKPRSVDWDSLPYGGDLFGELQLAASDGAEPRPSRHALLFPGLALWLPSTMLDVK